MLRYLLLMVFITGCSTTKRSLYKPFEKREGFKEKTVEQEYQAVSFKANAYTHPQDAELFAKFRAAEICKDKAFEVSHILDVQDKTQTKDVTYTSSNHYGPSYYYGMSPFYGRYYSSGFGFGFNNVQSNSYNVTYTYPEIEVFYECSNKVFEPKVFFRNVEAEEARHLVKDLKGAVQVESVLSDSPNKNTLKKGDIIVRARGERIETIHELLHSFKESPTKNEVAVEVLREGERMKLTLKAVDVTEVVKKSQGDIVQSACQKKEIKERAICRG